ETLRGSVLIGSPDTVVGKLKDLQRDIGLSGVQLETNCASLADHAAERKAIRLLAREVKSAFRCTRLRAVRGRANTAPDNNWIATWGRSHMGPEPGSRSEGEGLCSACARVRCHAYARVRSRCGHRADVAISSNRCPLPGPIRFDRTHGAC